MEDAWINLLSVVVGIVVGAVATFLEGRRKARVETEHARDQAYLEAEHAFDRELRDLRLPAYRALFHLTEALPRRRQGQEVLRRKDLLDLRESFHQWYFDDQAHGMFLSECAREAYFDLQNVLEENARILNESDETPGAVDPGAVQNFLYEKGSRLRHELSADLGSADLPRRERRVPRSVPGVK